MSSKKFQLTIDSDSVLISQAPNKAKSRITLANLDEPSIRQLAKSIEDAGITKELIKLLEQESKQ